MPLNYHSSGTAAAPSKSALSAYLLLAFAVLCWAGNFVVGRGLRFEAPPVALTLWRWSVALAVLAPFTVPYWIGEMPLQGLTLGSFRHLRPAIETAPRFASAADGDRLRHGLVVYDGGRPEKPV